MPIGGIDIGQLNDEILMINVIVLGFNAIELVHGLQNVNGTSFEK